jgi:hypothetical protein
LESCWNPTGNASSYLSINQPSTYKLSPENTNRLGGFPEKNIDSPGKQHLTDFETGVPYEERHIQIKTGIGCET